MLRQLASALPRFHILAVQPRAVVAVRGLKTHTGIAGLDVDPNARENLKSYLQQALEAIKIIPQEAEYRKNVENTINQKLSFVTSDITDEEVEDKLDAQLEQYINFVKDELSLIPKMAEWKPWEVPDGHKVEILEEQEVAKEQQVNAPQVPKK